LEILLSASEPVLMDGICSREGFGMICLSTPQRKLAGAGRAGALCLLSAAVATAQSSSPPAAVPGDATSAAASASSPAAPAPPPQFEAADIRPSEHNIFTFMRADVHGDRYVVRDASMVDLIAAAYGVKDDHVVSGPSWLEMDRFDIDAKLPHGTAPDTLKQMFQALLADRFKLVIHTDTEPMPAFLLTVGPGKPKLNPATGSGDSGCQNQPQPPAANEIPTTVDFCRNMTMAQFAQSLPGMAPAYLTEPVVDRTGLKGTWDFDIHWTPLRALQMAGPDGLSISDAVDKELGLKLEEKTAPGAALVVDKVSRKPTANPLDLEKILPPLPALAFDVAIIKPSSADEKGGNFGISKTSITLQNLPIKILMAVAWNLNPNDDDAIVGFPKSLEGKKFDITAKVDPSVLADTEAELNFDTLQPMLQALLIDRFKIAARMENRPLDAYTLVAASPKLKKADPSSRTHCIEGPGPGEKDPRIANPVLGRLIHCQNMTMAEFAEQLPDLASGYLYSQVNNDTKIEGRWDFTLSFSMRGQLTAALGGANNPSAQGQQGSQGSQSAQPPVSDPNGALSLFDAVNKQLGLRLEKQKLSLPVLVVDHMLDAPTEN
jgi:uncharacterized protein (TIGR03435 family)